MADPVINLSRGQILIGNYIVDAYDVEVTPHRAAFDYYESYEGLIGIQKQLDNFTELKFKVMLTVQNLPEYNSGDDEDTHRAQFIEMRRKFLDDVDGKVVPIASTMFKSFYGIVEAKPYNIASGETAAEYSIEIKEVE